MTFTNFFYKFNKVVLFTAIVFFTCIILFTIVQWDLTDLKQVKWGLVRVFILSCISYYLNNFLEKKLANQKSQKEEQD